MRRIVVSLRSCPIRLLSPYGCEWTSAPNFDRFASQSVVFDACWASQLEAKSSQHSYAETVNGFDSDVWKPALDRFFASEPGVFVLEIDPFALPWGPFQAGAIDLGKDEVREPFFEQASETVAAFDAHFGEILESIEKRDPENTSLIALTAQNGLPTGEHGQLGLINPRLFAEYLNIPLVIRLPERRFAGHRIAGMLTDVDFSRILRSGNCDEWVKWFEDSQSVRTEVVSTYGDPVREAALRTADSCLIRSFAEGEDSLLLFDRPDDRFEINNIAARQLDRAEMLNGKLAELIAERSISTSKS
ncbi:MAG: hypothetical protein U0798_06970 [Gemmataceae bacterium]